MKKKKLIVIICSALAAVIVASTVLIVALAGKGGKKDAIWIMAEEMSGLFNPFYATSGADHDVVGMTQIGMLSTDYIDGKPVTVAGDKYATVVKAFSYEFMPNEQQTVYKFVIKKGLKFADGKPLTMNDVMFNIYEYLDPIYTGSSTMYSTKIIGLANYRAQKSLDGSEEDESLSAYELAKQRRNELLEIYRSTDVDEKQIYEASPEEMKTLINNWEVTEQFKDVFGEERKTDSEYKEILWKDYELACDFFKKEIVNDYKASKDSFDFENPPYAEYKDKIKDNELFKFFLYMGEITPEYAIDDKTNLPDKKKIIEFNKEEIASRFSTADDAIKYVQDNKIINNFDQILQWGGTATQLLTRFEADAKAVLLSETGVVVDHIEGIKSLGHNTDVTTVSIKADASNTNLVVGGDQGEYKVARTHKSTGEPENIDEYDVLQITIEKVDPKAIYNFGFTVAPWHYYAADENGNTPEMDIANNKFGLVRANPDFQNNVIQSQLHVSIPMGAGAYMATDKNDSDTPAITEFNKDNTVYFKANHNFMFDVKCEKIRFMVVSSSNAIGLLASGGIDYITPQLTKKNYEDLVKLKSKGISVIDEWQLGYGYVGINAGLVPNIHVRRAIMAAMRADLVTQYYKKDAVKKILWPMSSVSWAYPYEKDANGKDKEIVNDAPYTQWTGEDDAIKKIEDEMKLAAGDGVTLADLKLTFTIAGSSITEHPTYYVFEQAMSILNNMKEINGLKWEIEIKPESQALTKLATGSLAVWAAAWGSTIDPDMYQVYHKDSTATSTLAWGYKQIWENSAKYSEEQRIINELSKLIDDGRATLDETERKGIYQNAMNKVLELAVEMPIYQRKNLFAYNSKAVKGFRETKNPYSSPLDRIWELELA